MAVGCGYAAYGYSPGHTLIVRIEDGVSWEFGGVQFVEGSWDELHHDAEELLLEIFDDGVDATDRRVTELREQACLALESLQGGAFGDAGAHELDGPRPVGVQGIGGLPDVGLPASSEVLHEHIAVDVAAGPQGHPPTVPKPGGA